MHYPSDISGDLEALEERFRLLADLSQVGSLLMWDRHTYMPNGASEMRGQQNATLETVIHEKLTEPVVGEWLARLSDAELRPDDAALVRICSRRFEQAARLPLALVDSFAKARARASRDWLRARRERDFRVFAPSLQHMFELSRERAERLGYDDRRYDALHDIYEPGSTSARVRAVFDSLREPLVGLVRAMAAAHDESRPDELLYGDFDEEAQERFVLEEVRRFGYDFERGRLDETVHPFAQSIGRDDVRITTSYRRDYLAKSIFATFHEAGHGLYEQGIAAEDGRSPLGETVSLGVHESQSRMWENLVGRSEPYWRGAFRRLQQIFPEAFGNVPVERFHAAVNCVKPSLIRIEADEVTYNLHVMVRFELEEALLEGDLDVADLPAAWNERYRQLLGVEPADDVEGCLQDVHWSMGLIGYFPTYTLGNVMSAQLFEAAREAIPDLDQRIEAGEHGALLGWLRENVHVHGSRLEPDALLKQVTGGDLDTAPYLRYLHAKFGRLYRLTEAA